MNTLNDCMLMVTYVEASVSERTYDSEIRGGVSMNVKLVVGPLLCDDAHGARTANLRHPRRLLQLGFR